VAVTLGKFSVLACFIAAALTAASAGIVLAQNNQAPAAATAPQQAPVVPQAAPAPAPASGPTLPPLPPPVEKRGFLSDFGHWWDDSVASFKAKWKENQSQLDDFNKKSSAAAKDAAAATGQAMKDAADAMVRLPTSKMVEIHEVCPVAGNGAPDCQTAASNACRGKGFKDGQPLDIRTAERCTASLWVSGQNPTSRDCPVETMVLRAACE
jgi:hypothetical protein